MPWTDNRRSSHHGAADFGLWLCVALLVLIYSPYAIAYALSVIW